MIPEYRTKRFAGYISTDEKDSPVKMAFHFDDLFDRFGHWNAYQTCLVACIWTLASWLVPSVSINFIAAPMDHWCDLSEHNAGNLTKDELKELLIPKDQNGLFEKCRMYAVGGQTPRNNSEIETLSCTKWEYDTSQFDSSIVAKVSLYLVFFLLQICRCQTNLPNTAGCVCH